MGRSRSLRAVVTRVVFGLGCLSGLCAVAMAAEAADQPPADHAPQPAPSLSPLEWNRSLITRGRMSERLGQNEDAMADYTLAIESHTLPAEEQARTLFDRGLLLDGMGRLDEALADYTASLALSSDFAAALNNRANVYRRLGRLAEARRDYLAAIDAGNPQSQFSYYGLGELAEAEGAKTQAEQFYTKALAADPKYDLARDRLAALSSGEQMARLEPPTANQATASAAPPLPPTEDEAATIVLRPPAGKPASAPRYAQQAALTGNPPLKPSLASHQRSALGTVGAQVQLGAWRSEAEANQGWDRALRQAGEALKGFSPRIVEVELPKVGRYYRLRVTAGEEGAKGLCASLAAKGLDCLPVRD